MERIHGWKLGCEEKCNSILCYRSWSWFGTGYKMMKVSGGCHWHTQNHNALTKFFQVALELSIIANEAHEMAGLKSAKTTTHYELSDAMTKRQENNVLKLVDTIKEFCDPFANEYDHVVNMVTKALISETSRTSSREMPLGVNCLWSLLKKGSATMQLIHCGTKGFLCSSWISSVCHI